MALFSGAHINNKTLALSIPLFAMFMSDIFIGFYDAALAVYIGMIIPVFLGSYMRKNNIVAISAMSALSALIFFIISNLGVWALTPYYAKNMMGLITCFIAAIPFFTNTLMSTMLYSVLFFALFSCAYKSKAFDVILSK
jgi:hypothetical protein